MSPRGVSIKAQLGARVPKDVREMAVADASRLGLSLNQYIENLIVQANQGRPLVTVADGQLAIGEPLAGVPVVLSVDAEEDTAQLVRDAETIARIDNILMRDVVRGPDGEEIIVTALTPFARNCTNGTLHWRHGPSNPCRFCGGEI